LNTHFENGLGERSFYMYTDSTSMLAGRGKGEVGKALLKVRKKSHKEEAVVAQEVKRTALNSLNSVTSKKPGKKKEALGEWEGDGASKPNAEV